MHSRFLGNLRAVILDNPYEGIREPAVQELFGKIIALKAEGYRSVHGARYLPVDTYDYFATHHLVCREDSGSFEILMGFKTVDFARCREHHLQFSAMSALRASSAPTHEAVLGKLLNRYENRPEVVTFGSSWTTSPDARENTVLKSVLKEMMIALLVSYEEGIGSRERICFATSRLKTDRHFETLGYQRMIDDDGSILPEFQLPLFEGRSVLLRCTEFSDYAKSLAAKYQDLWVARLDLNSGLRIAGTKKLKEVA